MQGSDAGDADGGQGASARPHARHRARSLGARAAGDGSGADLH